MSGVPSANTSRAPDGEFQFWSSLDTFSEVLRFAAVFPSFLFFFGDGPDFGARTTTPATLLRSAMPMPVNARCCACFTSSSGWEAPRKKEKLVVTASSA